MNRCGCERAENSNWVSLMRFCRIEIHGIRDDAQPGDTKFCTARRLDERTVLVFF